MNKKRMIVLLLILVAIMVLIFGFTRGGDAKIVYNLPSGFISLEEAVASSEGGLSYVFWESQISFLNSEGTCIYQTSVRDKSFIVKYKAKYYINGIKYNELTESLTNTRD